MTIPTQPDPRQFPWPTAYAEATIAAPPSVVWAILTDFEGYDDWNPFTYAVAMPTFAVGEIFTFTARMYTWYEHRPSEIIRIIEPNRCVAWEYVDETAWLHATRYQLLTATADGGTQYQTWESFNGWLSPLLGITLLGAVQRGFNDVAAALQQTAEQK